MTYVITEPCVNVKDGSCIDFCPVDCIYTGGAMLYIHPDECIACGLCETVCPVAAIYDENDLPMESLKWVEINAEFFGPAISGYGAPGGAKLVEPSDKDHPVVAEIAARATAD